jgi:hypothetical protein
MPKMKNFRGSQGAMLELINSGITEIEKVIGQSNVRFSKDEVYMPKSMDKYKEAELKDFLNDTNWPGLGDKIKGWWLEVIKQGTRTPNWDFVSTCTINGQTGLLLVEAKAHQKELKVNDRLKSTNTKNQNKIQRAISEAREQINKLISQESILISSDKCYQLSNRIAHAWWLANQGVPVILLYLGFLNRTEMSGNGKIFKNNEEWQKCFKVYASRVGVDSLINKEIDCGKGKFTLLIRSY